MDSDGSNLDKSIGNSNWPEYSPDSLTIAQAHAIVSQYFPLQWRSTPQEELKLRRITGGFVNRLHLLTRNSTTKDIGDEPTQVLIRHFGIDGPLQQPPESATTLSVKEQNDVYQIMASRGWGPKVYGTIGSVGRLEEWIASHPLTVAETSNPDISRDIARAYARLHSLNLPLRKDNFKHVVKELERIADAREGIAIKLRDQGLPETKEFAQALVETDWKNELEWITGQLEKHNCKATIATGDPNLLNILVKEFDSDCRVMLIDYETFGYSYRGIDIGGHFVERMYDWSNSDNVVIGYVENLDERRQFCDAYLEELEILGSRNDERDAPEHLLLEMKLGQMYDMLYSVLMCFLEGPIPLESQMAAGLTHTIRTYFQLRKADNSNEDI